MSEIVQQKVYVTVGGEIVQKNVLDITPEENQNIRNAMDSFVSVTKQLNPDFNEDALQAVIEKVDAAKRPADDSMSYTFANNEMRREARKQFEAEITARDQQTRSIEREAQLKAEREEYLRPSDRSEVARQPNQNLPDQPASPAPTREYTDAELDAMSSDDMVRLGIVSRGHRIEDRQGSSGHVFRPETSPQRTNEYRRRKDLMKPIAEIMGGSKGPRQRKHKFSAEELAAQEYRAQVIAQDQADRRKVKEDLERLREEQEEKRRNAKKQRRS